MVSISPVVSPPIIRDVVVVLLGLTSFTTSFQPYMVCMKAYACKGHVCLQQYCLVDIFFTRLCTSL